MSLTKLHASLLDLSSDEERDDFKAYLKSSAPTADQVQRFNRSEFTSLLTLFSRAPLAELPADPSIKSWFGPLPLAEGAQIALPGLAEVPGGIYLGKRASFSVPSLKSVGSVWAMEGSTLAADSLIEAKGYISADAVATIQAASLGSIGGVLEAQKDTKINAPALNHVAGSISVGENASLNLPALAAVGGDIVLNEGSSLVSPALSQVNSISACQGSTLHAAGLEKVSYSLWVMERAAVSTPALARIGGWCSLDAGANFEAPSLARIGGGTTIGEGANFNAPNLDHVVGELWLKSEARLTAPALSRVDGDITLHPRSLLDAPHLHGIQLPAFVSGLSATARPPLADPAIPTPVIDAGHSR